MSTTTQMERDVAESVQRTRKFIVDHPEVAQEFKEGAERIVRLFRNDGQPISKEKAEGIAFGILLAAIEYKRAVEQAQFKPSDSDIQPVF